MKSALILITLLGFISFLMTSCQHGANDTEESANALLVWSGEYMVDGCGFEIEIDGKRYKPDNENEIDEAFKVEGETPVVLTFERLGRQLDIRCGLSTQSRAMDAIRVVSVKKRT